MNIQENLLSINPMSRPGSKLNSVKKIVVHYVGNPNTSALANRNYFENLKNQDKVYASSNYIVGLEGEIIRCIPEDEVSWNSGDYNTNFESIGIENCHPESDGKFNEKTLNSLQELLVDICKRYNLNPLTDILRHYDIIGKRCPRYYVDNPKEWDNIKNKVKKLIEGDIPEPPSRGEEYIVVATLGLNVRKEADINSQILMAYPYMKVVTVYDKLNGWGKTNDGWISMDWVQLKDANQGEEYRITATLGLNSRIEPNINSRKITSYPYNTIITIYEISNGWGRTKDGWVSMEWVTKVISQGQSYKVNATLGLNIRKGPSMNEPKVSAYKYNTVISVYEISNGWGRTNEGWISMDWVQKM